LKKVKASEVGDVSFYEAEKLEVFVVYVVNSTNQTILFYSYVLKEEVSIPSPAWITRIKLP
jgi:hypothetical protein